MATHGSMWCHEPQDRASLRPPFCMLVVAAVANCSTGARSGRGAPGRVRRSRGTPCRPPTRRTSPDSGRRPVRQARRCRWTTTSPTATSPSSPMIRFQATGDKIGSLVINPGGPGESGVDAAASMVTRRCRHRLRERFDLVGFDPRGVRLVQAGGVVQLRRRQRPAARRPAGRLQPGRRRPHRERDQGVRAALRRQDGQGVPGATSAPPNVVKDLDAHAGRRSATTS